MSSFNSSSSTSQPFIFGAGAQNTTTFRPFGNPPSSTTPANFTPANSTSPFILGSNAGAQSPNVFGSNLAAPSNVFGLNPVVQSSNIFGSNSTAQAPSVFGSNSVASSNVFGSNASVSPSISSSNPAAQSSNVFGLNPGAQSSNIFGSNLIRVPFNFTPFPTQATFPTVPVPSNNSSNRNATAPITKPGISDSFSFQTVNSVPAPSTNPVASTATSTPHISIAAATVPTGNIFVTPAFPLTNIFGTQSTTPKPMPSSLSSSSAATTTFSTFDRQSSSGFPVSHNQSTITSPASTQGANILQSATDIHQRFIAASLFDPYGNPGKKDFPTINKVQAPVEPPAVSTVPSTITTSTLTPSVLPIQSNLIKVSSSRSPVDVNFKLKPVSSSPVSNENVKPSHRQSIAEVGPMKSTLAGNFTDEEELVLLGRTKLSKLRVSNDTLNSSYHSDSASSFYPIRRLAELEKMSKMTSALPSSPIDNETKSNASNDERAVLPNYDSNSLTVSNPLSSPDTQRKSNADSNAYCLPILTRDNYYMKPNVVELKTLFDDKGQCFLQQFTVGHEKYGSVTFYGHINVAGLNLDQIINIEHQEVTVYPDDENKPSVGEELNLPARITLLGIYPIDRATHKEIVDAERLKAMNYSDYLRKMTAKFDGEFVNYDSHDGSWTFMVQHFTRYGLDDDQDDAIDH